MASHTEPLILSSDTLPHPTAAALRSLSSEDWLQNETWYLAGGTALALSYQHRASYELDFFTTQPEFDVESVIRHFPQEWITTTRELGTLYGEWRGVKVSFIAYPQFQPSGYKLLFEKVPVLQPNDIAVMKIIAICQRGKKRDFFDLYWHLTHSESLENVLRRVPKQYSATVHNFHHFLKSLVYFEDAEADPDVVTTSDVSWSTIKTYFVEQVTAVAKILLP